MKLPRILLLVFSIFLCSSAFAQGEKHAIIISVGDYPEGSGWDDLSSANDIALINNILAIHEFSPSNIWLLRDAQASKAGIPETFTRLEKRVSKGDIVYIHYSGHGQQVIDQNKDEIDGYDEALVPYDAAKRYKKGVYEGENHLRDDGFGEILKSLQKALGPDGSILVTIDACHSGTASRGARTAKFRGSGEPCAPEGYEATRGGSGGGMFEQAASSKKLASLVVISGSRHDQLNSEAFDKDGNSCGSLSYSLCRGAQNLSSGSSYKAWFDRIKLEMSVVAPNQDPQIEGAIDESVFGGEASLQEQYYQIETIKDNKFIVVRVGKMSAVHEGTIIGLYPIGTARKDDVEAITTGVVIESSELYSTVELEMATDLVILEASWVFIEEQNFGGVEVALEVELSDKGLEKKLKKQLEDYLSIDVVKNKGELIVTDVQAEGGLHLYTKSDAPLLQSSHSDHDSLVGVVTNRVAKYAKAKYLREINFYNNDLDLEIEIVPVEYEKKDGKYVVSKELDLDDYITDGNQIEFPINTTFVIRVTNKGRKRAFFNLIHISPDNEVDVYIPFKRQSAAECVLNPRQSITFDKILLISDPARIDIFKVVATDAPLDLRPTSTEDKTTHAGENPFAAVYNDAVSGERQTRAVPVSTFNTYSLVVKVVEE